MTSTSIITILLLCWMFIDCNFLTIVLYNLFKTISNGLTDLIMEIDTHNFVNIRSLKKEFKVEYFLSIETCLFIGRLISNSLFIVMAFSESNIILVIFIIFAILRMLCAMGLQKTVGQNNELFKGGKLANE